MVFMEKGSMTSAVVVGVGIQSDFHCFKFFSHIFVYSICIQGRRHHRTWEGHVPPTLTRWEGHRGVKKS